MTIHPAPRIPDGRDGKAYVLQREISFAVKVAVATGRPLLLRGEPGSGKSSLAAHLARTWNWRYYEHVVTSRTGARDLLWSFDAVRRLGDAQLRQHGERPHDIAYVEPGVLWWAFAPDSAAQRGGANADHHADDPNPDNARRAREHAVVLIDEIDKADPDMPNGILVPLGSSEFEVTETRTRIRAADDVRPLIIITTNEDRELPQAFLRRCVVAWLPELTGEHLVKVATEHLRAYGEKVTESDTTLAEALARELMAARRQAADLGVRKPSTAEFLDALRAIRELGIEVGSPEWEDLRSLVLIKVQQPAA
ncbi:AAA family ATPase [Actinoplanes subglobosus]|uniref:AAA family ATPase n=1 Tax=Actinoplanes subglobosus TaxID=1547892 RepID=A0ABV8J9V5_9ACTN